MPFASRFVLSLSLLSLCVAPLAAADKPLMREFIGVNGHTVQFKPELYAQTCRKVRDYHSLEWDLGNETDYVPQFPEARNRVNWNDVYGSWQRAGFETDVCVMFNNTPPDSWKDLNRDAFNYGKAFARAFGPGSERKLVTSIEIGNEPGKYPDERYRALFEAMARGVREGDPKLRIATCNIVVGKSGDYEKSVHCVAGLEPLYDALNVHTYAIAKGWPEWRRAHPEDPGTNFLTRVQETIDWRDREAPGKAVWVTEFGWDASTAPKKTEGDAAKWEGNVSDEQQAQYLVRSFLLFAAMDVERAYMYFFNDSNEPSFHASSGITRNFEPKASFHAIAHLSRSLGEYRFSKVLRQQAGDAYVYVFTHGETPNRRVIVAWSPTGSGRAASIQLDAGGRVARCERMPTAAGDVPAVKVDAAGSTATIPIGESPLYLWIEP
jgi:hypothetical protein